MASAYAWEKMREVALSCPEGEIPAALRFLAEKLLTEEDGVQFEFVALSLLLLTARVMRERGCPTIIQFRAMTKKIPDESSGVTLH